MLAPQWGYQLRSSPSQSRLPLGTLVLPVKYLNDHPCAVIRQHGEVFELIRGRGQVQPEQEVGEEATRRRPPIQVGRGTGIAA